METPEEQQATAFMMRVLDLVEQAEKGTKATTRQAQAAAARLESLASRMEQAATAMGVVLDRCGGTLLQAHQWQKAADIHRRRLERLMVTVIIGAVLLMVLAGLISLRT